MFPENERQFSVGLILVPSAAESSQLPRGWRISAMISLLLVNNKDAQRSVRKGAELS
jgi:hypothetical protein